MKSIVTEEEFMTEINRAREPGTDIETRWWQAEPYIPEFRAQILLKSIGDSMAATFYIGRMKRLAVFAPVKDTAVQVTTSTNEPGDKKSGPATPDE